MSNQKAARGFLIGLLWFVRLIYKCSKISLWNNSATYEELAEFRWKNSTTTITTIIFA